jgi:hypothetical protein
LLLTANLHDLEKISKKYVATKQGGRSAESADLAVEIIELISSPDFPFRVKEEALVSGNTTTYLYENNATYPFLFEFLSETLHSKIPIIVEDAKLGPGEILVTADNKESADAKLTLAINGLKNLIHARKAEASYR